MTRRRLQEVLLLAGVIVVIVAFVLFRNWVVGPVPSQDDPATATCRTAYQQGGARAYRLTENDYIAKCVQGINDLHSDN